MRSSAQRDGVRPILSTYPWQVPKDAGTKPGGPAAVNTQGMTDEEKRRMQALGYLR